LVGDKTLDTITRKPEKSMVTQNPEDYNVNKKIEIIYDIIELVYIDRVLTRIRSINAVSKFRDENNNVIFFGINAIAYISTISKTIFFLYHLVNITWEHCI
jgi:hypothetical protein